MNEAKALSVDALQKIILALGVFALGASAFGFFRNAAEFYRAYLLGFLYWTNMPLGCLFFVLIHNLTGGRWGEVVRKNLLAGAGTFALSAFLFLPLLLGKGHLYSWSIPAEALKNE